MGTMLCWRGANLPAGTIPWKAMSVCGRVAFCGSDGDDNGDAGAGGQPPAGAFPKAFAQVMRLLPRLPRCQYYGWQKSSGGLDPARAHEPERHQAARIDQLFSSDLIRLSNSWNEISPLIISPLMKKVGVELTLSTSVAYF